jgi:acetoin utilization deacetylase AcuC-like enzyme
MTAARDLRVFCTDGFDLPLPPGHRFPLRKYAQLRERVAAIAADLLVVPPGATDAELALAHDAAYVAAVTAGQLDARALRRIGFPWSAAMVERSRRSTGATIAACRSALASGCGVSLAGGTHHAHRDHGEGFCVFNDAAVAARVMQREGRAARVLIVDLDVHQGDGSAAILGDDDTVFTLSIHGRNNFPFRKQASRLDIELDDGTGDAAYLAALRVGLRRSLATSRPDLAIYLAGADPYAGDRLGRLALTKAGLARRDAYVFDTLGGDGVPVAVVMAGGYAEPIADTVDIHFTTVALALGRHAGHRVLDCAAFPPATGAAPASESLLPGARATTGAPTPTPTDE